MGTARHLEAFPIPFLVRHRGAWISKARRQRIPSHFRSAFAAFFGVRSKRAYALSLQHVSVTSDSDTSHRTTPRPARSILYLQSREARDAISSSAVAGSGTL